MLPQTNRAITGRKRPVCRPTAYFALYTVEEITVMATVAPPQSTPTLRSREPRVA